MSVRDKVDFPHTYYLGLTRKRKYMSQISTRTGMEALLCLVSPFVAKEKMVGTGPCFLYFSNSGKRQQILNVTLPFSISATGGAVLAL